MKKKIDLFWYWFILVVAFVLCFFAVTDKKISAYSLDSNGNLVSDNLFNSNLLNGQSGIVVSNNGQTIILPIMVGDTNGAITTPIKLKEICPNMKVGKTYVWDFKLNYTGPNEIFYITNSSDPYWWRLQPRTITQQDLDSTFYLYGNKANEGVSQQVIITDFMIVEGVEFPLTYEPFGVWYSPTYAENIYQGRLPSFTSSLTYTNQDTGVTSTINDVNSYIDNSFGYLYFDRLWVYLDTFTGSSYDNARLTINFNDNLNINTSYIINSNKENYGSGVWFYQNDELMLDVRNFSENSYCGGAVLYSCNVELNKYVNVGSGVNSFSYLNKIVVWSSTSTERTLAFGYNNIGYNTGYDNGYNVGYKDGKKVADDLIYNNGYTDGYNIGYDKGVNYASNGGNTLVGLVGAVFTAPVNMLHTIFNFEFLGINLTNFLFSLISLFIVIWLIRKFL